MYIKFCMYEVKTVGEVRRQSESCEETDSCRPSAQLKERSGPWCPSLCHKGLLLLAGHRNDSFDLIVAN